MAVIRALEVSSGPVNIITDSMYTINCINTWISGWKKNNWKSSTGEPVKNQDLIKKLDTMCQDRKVNFAWCKGHSNSPGNDEADKLATLGMSKPL